jgi:hypothetical protein
MQSTTTNTPINTRPDKVEIFAWFVLFGICYYLTWFFINVITYNLELNSILTGWLWGFFAPVMLVLGSTDDTFPGIYGGTGDVTWYDLGFVSGLIMYGWATCWTKNFAMRQ